MNIDRPLQRALLEHMKADYPGDSHDLEKTFKSESADFIGNLLYLQEHGLIEAVVQRTMANEWLFASARVTAKGIDFLEDDGGLSAMLSTITVKLDATTIKQIIETKIEAAPIADEEKQGILAHLKDLPAQALEAGTQRLIEAALDQVPNAVQLLRTALGL